MLKRKDVSLRAFAERWIIRARGQSPATARSYVWGLEGVARFIGRSPEALTAADWWRYLEESDDPATTKRVKLAAGKSYHRFVCRQTGASPNGILAIPAPKVYFDTPIPRITKDQATLLLCSAFDPITVRLMYGGLFTGQRPSELAQMDESRWVDGVIQVPVTKRRSRLIPAHPELERVRDLILSVPCTLGQLAYAGKKLADELEIVFSAKDLRRMFIHVLDEAGTEWRIVQSMTGHLNDTTSKHYSAPSMNLKRAALAPLDYLDEVPMLVKAFQPRLF